MLTRLTGGQIYDPPSGRAGQQADLFLDGDRIVAQPPADVAIDRHYDLTGMVVMAGGIDLHTHIGGGKVALARLLLPELQRLHAVRGGTGGFLPSAAVAGRRYLEMGYTSCFEPAVIPCNARGAHAEMADIPGIDTGGYVVLGNDELLLRLLASGAEPSLINDYVAWMVRATQCIGVKVVNAGGISAFKYGQRRLEVDQPHPHYGVTPATIIRSLARAVHAIGLAHPLHVHCSNLGVPGNIDSTLKTIAAADGLPIHLTHVQFHSYGDAGPQGFSSAAAQLADALRVHPNVTIDVGQVMFGQTVTISADTAHQYENRQHAKPRKSILVDIECEAGCGVVPFRYENRRYVNALQWAIGLELFLMVDDPTRVFLTTDHPNGGAFTTYPHLIRLLADRSFRETALDEIDPEAAAASQLRGIDRQYSLAEIAAMTRSGPSRILGLADRGHLAPGALADVVAYWPHADRQRMFSAPALVFRRGELVVRDGEVVEGALPRVAKSTQAARPSFDPEVSRRLEEAFRISAGMQMPSLWISDEEMAEVIGSPVFRHPPAHLAGTRSADSLAAKGPDDRHGREPVDGN